MQPSYPTAPSSDPFWPVLQYPPVTLVVGLVAIGAAGVLTAALLQRVGIPHQANQPGHYLALALQIAGTLGAYRLFTRFVEHRPNLEFARPDSLRELAAGLVAGFVLFSAVVGVIALFGGYHVVGRDPSATLLPVLAVGFGPGFIEEIIARGLIFRLVEQWLGSWVALAVSAALFGAAHLGNPNATWLAGTAIALEAGIMLAALYMLTRRLWAAIGLHAAWNMTQGGVYGIPVSGSPFHGLLRDRPAGPVLLTGGAFGAEASLPAVLICGAFGAALVAACIAHDRVVPFLPRRRG